MRFHTGLRNGTKNNQQLCGMLWTLKKCSHQMKNVIFGRRLPYYHLIFERSDLPSLSPHCIMGSACLPQRSTINKALFVAGIYLSLCLLCMITAWWVLSVDRILNYKIYKTAMGHHQIPRMYWIILMTIEGLWGSLMGVVLTSTL